MTTTTPRLCLLLSFLIVSGTAAAAGYEEIVIPASCPPAIHSAARILVHKFGLSDAAIRSVPAPGAPAPGEIVLTDSATPAEAAWLGSTPKQIKQDGYAVIFKAGGALIYGARPRSLLYAVGDVNLWKNRVAGTYVRDPTFAIRAAAYNGHESVAEYVAAMGANIIIGKQVDANPVTFKDTLPDIYAELSRERGRAP